MLKRLTGFVLLTSALALLAPAEEIHYVTLEMRHNWEPPERLFVQAAKKVRKVKRARTPKPQSPIYRRIA